MNPPIPIGAPSTANPVQQPIPLQQQSFVPQPNTSQPSISSLIANPKVNPKLSDVLSKIQAMTRHISDPNQRAAFIKAVSQQLNAIGNASKCVCIHALFPDLKYEEKDSHLRQIEELYTTARGKPVQNIYRSLSAICPPCLYLKMGLLSTDVVKDFRDSSCSSKTGPQNTYNLGPMFHALTSFNVNQKVYPNMQNAMNISFHPGNILIPDSKIFLQMLAMPSNLIDQGVKVIWVDTDETAVCNDGDIDRQMKVYEKFMKALPDSLDNGYYKGNTAPLISLPTSSTSLSSSSIDRNKLISNPPDKFIKVGNNEHSEVLLKIFDVNSVLNIYYSQLIQSQRRLQMKTISSIDDDGSRLYLNRTNFACYEPLSTHRMHDFLALAIALSDDPNTLKDFPPLNGECITTPHNILIINKNGKAVFTASTEPKPPLSTTACEKLKRGLKDGNKYPPNKRFVNTAHTATPKPGEPNKPDTFPELNNVTSPNLADIAMEKHINDSSLYRKSLKTSKDNLDNYFIEFKDDLNNPIIIDDVNLSTIDIAIGLYPNKIIDPNRNTAKPENIDIFSDISKDGMNVLEIASPNVVYSPNIGFITLKSLCSNEMLVLKNTITYLPNITSRIIGENFRKVNLSDLTNKSSVFISPNYSVEIRNPTEYFQVVDKKIDIHTSIPPVSSTVSHVEQDLCDNMSFDQYVQLYTPPQKQGCIW